MGLFNFLSDGKHPQVGDSVGSTFGGGHDTSSRVRILPIFGTRKKNNKAPSPRRICRVEELERREMLAANPIDFGAVYLEGSVDNDMNPDTFVITWGQGEANTKLDKVVISLDKNGNGKYDVNDLIFNTKANDQYGYGSHVDENKNPCDWYSPFDTNQWDMVKSYEISDDQMTLTIYFKDFTAGKEFAFTVDTDAILEIDANGNPSYGDPISSGALFQGCSITTTFTHQNFYDLTSTARFVDFYNDYITNDNGQRVHDPAKIKAIQDILNLPDDNFNRLGQTNNANPAATAGALKIANPQTPLPIKISGFVYEDNNRSNTFDANENGIGGVQLELRLWNEATGQYERIGTGKFTTTNSDGSYNFDDVLPGRYQIVETQPAGYDNVSSQPGNVGGQIRGQSIDANVLANINLVGGDDSVQNNFGEIRPGAISGFVYEDDDNDGIKDSTEAGIGGVVIELYELNDNGQYVFVRNTTTASNGHYEFTGLSPNRTYKVVEEQPPVYLDGQESQGTVSGVKFGNLAVNDEISGIIVEAGVTGIDFNFGELRPSSISGFVAVDQNGNNVLDTNDLYLEGVTIELTYWENGELKTRTTKTDVNGYYIFNDLMPGLIYNVKEIQPAGFFDGPDFVGTGIPVRGALAAPDSIIGIEIATAGTHGVRYDFLELPGGSISGGVFIEGTRTPIPNVTIILVDSNGTEVGRMDTLPDGSYRFDNLDPNETYTVRQIQPQGFCDGDVVPGTHGGNASGAYNLRIQDEIVGIQPGSQNATGYDFFEFNQVRLSGHVYEDLDDDGIIDPGEPGIGNVTLWLWRLNTTTNQYERARSTTWNPETGVFEVNPLTGNDLVDYVNTQTLSVAGNGHPVGYYEFLVCPNQTYRVSETQPPDFISGQNTEGSLGGVASDPDDWISDVTLLPNQNGTDYNFGELREARLSGYVYVDVTLNNGRTDMTTTDNGNFDAGETGINGITVQLWRLNKTTNQYELVTTDVTRWNEVTKQNGYYEFANLAPGTYKIVESQQPADYYDGKDALGSLGGQSLDDLDTFTGIVVRSGDDGTDYNFGELTPAKISGYVFQDGDTIYYNGTKPNVETVRDGVKNSSDRPISGVTLVLCNASGDPLYDDAGKLITTTTNANGYYEFDGLPPEIYGIREIQPSDYENGINTVGTWDGLVQNGYIPNGFAQNPGSPLDPTQLAMLAGNDPTDLIFLINVNYGEHAANNNFSEVLYTPSTPDFPPPPNEWDFPGPPDMAIGNPVNNYGLMYTPPVLNQSWTPGVGGGGIPLTYSWHLSVINAGYPRSVLNDAELAYGYRAQGVYMNVSWQAYDMGQTQWVIYNTEGKAEASFLFGPGFGTAVAGDFNGDGIAEMAVFFDGYWLVDLNGNGVWDDDDLWIKMGSENDQPIVGDWDGDGKTDIGVFGPEWPGDLNAMRKEPGLPTDLNQKVSLRPTNVPPDPQDAPAGLRAMKHTNRGRVRLDVVDHVFRYGAESDRAIVGDFNGDGTKQIGVYRNGTWHIDYNGNGQWDAEDIEAKTNHKEGDIPIVGDFTGEGVDRIGIYTPSTGRVAVDTNGNYQFDNDDLVFYLEGIDDVEAFPVVGDFNGDGIDQISLVKHIEKIPMHTRVVPQRAPMAVEATSAPVISSEFLPGNWGSSTGVE